MKWKLIAALLTLYALIAGLTVPLKPGITDLSPEVLKCGEKATVTFKGYNTFYSASAANTTRVWLQYDSLKALAGQNIRILNDTTLSADFDIPNVALRPSASVMLNAIVDHAKDGVSLLPSAVELRQDGANGVDSSGAWTANPVSNLHVLMDFSFPYRNVIYESIRNTYFHVPMWFGLMFLFIASVWNSILYLRTPDPDYDRKAATYAEMGLLFGVLGLVTGMLWAHYAWGKAWSNDIKQLMTAVALLIYMAYFILRRSFEEPEKGARLAAVYNIFAFASLVPLLYIVPRLFASLHPGATGNPAFGSEDLDNTMRMVFYPSILGFSGIGFWLANLRIRMWRIEDKLNDI
jgi:heme exporter protein C